MRELRPSLGSIQRLLLSFCVCTAGLGAVSAAVVPDSKVYAAVPKLDNIRVALFIDTGKYSDVTPSVTLSSDNGLALSFQSTNDKAASLSMTSGPAPAKVSLDAYRILLWESGDAAQVKAAAKLISAKEEAIILSRIRLGKPVYQLLTGNYATKEAAAAAMTKGVGASAIAGVSKGFAARIMGPLYWNVGMYATEAAAAAQAAAVGQAGFDADVAYLDSPAGNSSAYAVMVGGVADTAELNALKPQLEAAFPAAQLQPVDPKQAYAIKRSVLDLSAEGGGEVPQFMMGGTANKLRVSPKEGSTFKVDERYARSYRGELELSSLNGKLAVINELPFEQYLVSVVSSELSKEWPLEALKAQAVAARTFALKQGVKYQIAHVSDTTVDQAYKGAGVEFSTASEAVQGTQGVVLTDKNGLISSPLFYSNAGGLTADSTEVWGNKVDYLKSVSTPDDGAQKGKAIWYHIVLPNGKSGYISSVYARDTGRKNAAGLPYYEGSDTGVSVRSAPYVDNSANPALFKVNLGDRFVVIDQVIESNAYSWVRGPYDANKLKDKVNAVLPQPISGTLERLEVSQRGPSGRVIQMKANGQEMKPAYPDALRTVFNSLPSTRFEIEETGRYTILGAGGTVRNQSPSMPTIYLAGSGETAKGQPLADAQLFVLNGANQVRLTDKQSQFIFKGTGNGHGLGMSQWGAKGYAELGYDYKKILQTYYVGVSIIKE